MCIKIDEILKGLSRMPNTLIYITKFYHHYYSVITITSGKICHSTYCIILKLLIYVLRCLGRKNFNCSYKGL